MSYSVDILQSLNALSIKIMSTLFVYILLKFYNVILVRSLQRFHSHFMFCILHGSFSVAFLQRKCGDVSRILTYVKT